MTMLTEDMMDPKSVKPTHDFVLVETVMPPTERESGLLLPQSAVDKELRLRGTVVATGPGRRNKNGVRVPLDVAVGDVVHIGHYVGRSPAGLPKNFLLVRETDLLCVEEEDETGD